MTHSISQKNFYGGLGFLTCTLFGCALTSKGSAADVKYFTISSRPLTRASPSTDTPLHLQLGEVQSSEHLDTLMAFHKPDGEVGFRDEKRWTEKPRAYLRRALAKALFEYGSFQQVVSGEAPVLDVELLDFSEVVGVHPMVRIEVSAMLRHEDEVPFQHTFVATRPLSSVQVKNTALVANALSDCMLEITQTIARAASNELLRWSQKNPSDSINRGSQTPRAGE